MAFNYKELCKKMDFDPLIDELPRDPNPDVLDDRPSPFEKLTYDELVFLEEYLLQHRK